MLLFLLLLLSYLKIARKTTESQVGQYAPIVITVQVRILGRFSQIHNSKTNKRKQKCTILREGSFDFMDKISANNSLTIFGLNIGTINFLLGTNGKSMVLCVPIGKHLRVLCFLLYIIQ